MGANLQVLGFKDSIKTVEAAKKDFDKRAEQDRYENGHSYSGSYGMLGALTYVSTIFDTEEDFQDFLEHKYKNDGYLARVRVIRETKPLIAARVARFELQWDAQQARRGDIRDPKNPGRWKAGTPNQLKRVLDKFAKLDKKYRDLVEAQVKKSRKTRFIAGGWVSE